MTPDGFTIVYISDYFFDILEKELMRVAIHSGGPNPPPIALRDDPAMIEFRRLSDKKFLSNE